MPPRSTPRSWSASPPRRSTSASTGTPRSSTSAPSNTQAATTAVDNLLGAQANPENPSEVNVSQPSDALTAQADAEGAFDTLFLGLGAVALLVGAVGVANIMIISVLERRQEIGLRRALGATRGQIRIQFLAEAILLSLAGGVAGVIAGAASTAVYAHSPGRGRRHPGRGLGRRPGRRLSHRRPRRAAARHPRRPPVTHPGTLDRLTGQLTGRTGNASRGGFRPRDARPSSPGGTAAANARATATRSVRPATVTLSRAAAAPASTQPGHDGK